MSLNKKILFLSTMFFIGCNTLHHNPSVLPISKLNANDEIIYIHKTDQMDRIPPLLIGLPKRDEIRRLRVHQLYKQNSINTPEAMNLAAWVLIHGKDSLDFKLSYTLASNAVDSGYVRAKLTKRSAYDHWMVSIGKEDAKIKVTYKKDEDY